MTEPDKKKLSERDISPKFVTSTIVGAGLDLLTQIWDEVALIRKAGKAAMRNAGAPLVQYVTAV